MVRDMGDSSRDAGGFRRSRFYILSDNDIVNIKSELKAINADESVFLLNQGYQTGYLDDDDVITVRGVNNSIR